jgi:hypothetical protein
MKKFILSLIAVVGVAGAVLAQPVNSSTETNAAVTALENNLTSTNRAVFTLSTSTRPYRVVVQNQSGTEKVWVSFKSVTAGTNALAGAEVLNTAGNHGDKVVLEGVIPDPLVISARSGTTNVTSTLNITVQGRPK